MGNIASLYNNYAENQIPKMVVKTQNCCQFSARVHFHVSYTKYVQWNLTAGFESPI